MSNNTVPPWEAVRIRNQAVKDAEASGVIADSMEVRLKLMSQVKSGKISLKEAQAELAKIKSSAAKNGLITRQQAHSRA